MFKRVSALRALQQGLGCALMCSVCLCAFAQGQTSPSGNVDISVFSTYPSDQVLARCKQAVAAKECIQDSIAPEVFVKALSSRGWFNRVAAFSDALDYELLIAHTSGPSSSEDTIEALHFTEVTLLWRGMEIDSRIIENAFPQDVNNLEKAVTVLTDWFHYSQHSALFTAAFLYSSLSASNYVDELVVPSTLGDFARLDTQLYPDPFKGVITRYTHREFEEALVDVTVYPILAPLEHDKDQILIKQLKADWEKAEAVAEHQALTLYKQPAAARYQANSEHAGWRLGIKAESATQDTIYATTYVFQQHDKIVKIATTFPSTQSDPIANALIAQIAVPEESSLMMQVRPLIK
ncbi:hypothetical protein [Alteromonas profundi]|nr:hypothetical protein [Alteromonas profundi]